MEAPVTQSSSAIPSWMGKPIRADGSLVWRVRSCPICDLLPGVKPDKAAVSTGQEVRADHVRLVDIEVREFER